MPSDRWLSSLDAWKTDAPEMPSVNDRNGNRQAPFECLDCCAHDMSALIAFDHHRQDHHRITNRVGMLMHFSCCNNGDAA